MTKPVNPASDTGGNRQNRRERRWASKKEVAANFGVTERTVERWTDDGYLQAYRVGGRILRFDLNEVDALARPIQTGRIA